VLFFLLISVVSVLAAGIQMIAGQPGDWPRAMRWGLSFGLLFVGVDHFVVPRRYLPMIPKIMPFPRALVLFTGLCEIAGGVGLLIPALRMASGWALALYFVCVFPANLKNLKNALCGQRVEGLPQARWYYWLRLGLQPLVIGWALFAAGVI